MTESLLDQVMRDTSGVPDARTALETLIRKLGGFEKFIGEVAEDFNALDAGHTNRIRLEQFILTMLERCIVDSPVDAMDPETLRRVLREELTALKDEQSA